MAITLVTGVPGTGKTAQVVSMILDAVASGRPVFVDGVKGLHNTTPFDRCNSGTVSIFLVYFIFQQVLNQRPELGWSDGFVQ